MKKFDTITQLVKICNISRGKLEMLIQKAKITPSFVKGTSKYYQTDLIIELSEKYTTVSSYIEKKKIDIDYRTILKEINKNEIKPIFIDSNKEYYEVQSIIEIIKQWKQQKPLYLIAEIIGIGISVLKKLVKYQNISPKRTTKNNHQYFDIDEVKKAYEQLVYARKNYKIVASIEKEYKFNRDLLRDAINKYNVEAKYVNEYSYYDEEEVLQAFEKRRKDIDMKLKKKAYSAFYDKLHPDLQTLINDYIELRENGLAISYANYQSGKEIAHPKQNLRQIKNKIATVLFRIAAYRTEKEGKEVVSPVYFDITSINKNDYIPIKKNYKNSTLKGLMTAIKPFLMNLLSNTREFVLNSKDYTMMMTLYALELGVEEFLVQFPSHNKEGAAQRHPIKINKAFLTRAETIQVYELLLTDPRSKYPMKNATMWVLGTTLGIRPNEFMWLKIEYFLLNQEGFLSTDENGWGKLNIPPEASKMDMSPSNEHYQTPIPPDVVSMVNQYLTWLYEKQGKHNERGKGYMFRKYNQFPEIELSTQDKQFMNRIKDHLAFLNLDQQQDFELKASRRTMNNLFVESISVLPENLRGRIAEVSRAYQMRHAIKSNHQAEIGERHYTAPISKEEFYSVLDYVISFPWDKKELVLWEIEKGYRDGSEKLDIEFNDQLEEKKFAELINNKKMGIRQEEVMEHSYLDTNNKLYQRQMQLETRLKEIQTPPNNDVEFAEWRKEIVKLRKEKDEIEIYLKRK